MKNGIKGQGLVEFALIAFLVAILVFVLLLLIFSGGKNHASNEFCRTDMVGKMSIETCITPAYPMPDKR